MGKSILFIKIFLYTEKNTIVINGNNFTTDPNIE